MLRPTCCHCQAIHRRHRPAAVSHGGPVALQGPTSDTLSTDRSFRPVGRQAGVAMEYVEAGGFRLRVKRTGRGPAILLIMGLGGSIETWEPLRRQLSGHELILVDHPGMGMSSV